MDVKIDADAMTAVVSRAILEGISSEQRDVLLEQAVTALVTVPRGNGYSAQPQKTPLQEAFDLAATSVVRKVAMEMVGENEEFTARVRQMVGEAISEVSDRDANLQQKVALAVGEALIAWKYDR